MPGGGVGCSFFFDREPPEPPDPFAPVCRRIVEAARVRAGAWRPVVATVATTVTAAPSATAPLASRTSGTGIR